MKRFEYAQIGDKVYSRCHGFGTITAIDFIHNIITVFFNSKIEKVVYNFDGTYYGVYEAEQNLFYVDVENKYSEIRPLPKIDCSEIPIDTKVFLYNSNTKKNYPYHFSFYDGEYCYIYIDGKTSHTTSEILGCHTNILSLGEDVIINGIVYSEGTKFKS